MIRELWKKWKQGRQKKKDLIERLINDPRFKSDPQFREQALEVIKSLKAYRESQLFAEKFMEDFSRMTGYASFEESEKAFRDRLDSQLERLQAEENQNK